MDLSQIGKLLGDALRILYPGVLSLILWDLGHTNSNNLTLRSINKHQIVSMVAVAGILGVIIHALIRHGFFDLVIGPMARLFLDENEMPDKAAGSRARFFVWRFSKDPEDKLTTYLTRQWSWVHALTSTALLVPLFCLWASLARPSSPLAENRFLCFTIAMLTMLAVGCQCRILWKMEAEWYRQENHRTSIEEKHTQFRGRRTLTAIILVTITSGLVGLAWYVAHF